MILDGGGGEKKRFGRFLRGAEAFYWFVEELSTRIQSALRLLEKMSGLTFTPPSPFLLKFNNFLLVELDLVEEVEMLVHIEKNYLFEQMKHRKKCQMEYDSAVGCIHT